MYFNACHGQSNLFDIFNFIHNSFLSCQTLRFFQPMILLFLSQLFSLPLQSFLQNLGDHGIRSQFGKRKIKNNGEQELLTCILCSFSSFSFMTCSPLTFPIDLLPINCHWRLLCSTW